MRMRLSWLWAFLIGGALVLSISGCDDSSTVGLGVGPDSLQGGAPVTLDVFPSLDTTTVAPQTGLALRPGVGVGRDQWRFLVGRVDDPVGGTIEADGSFDLLGRRFLSAPLLEADADSLEAKLRLLPNYVHGDTAAQVDVRVFELSEEAEMDGATADTTFPAANEVTTASISPTDSLITVDLPQSWISDNLSALRDTSDGGAGFEEAFHGFKLVPGQEANAVVGFSSVSATLRLSHVNGETSADFASFKSFTHVERRNVPASPSNYVVLQGGVGKSLTMRWDYDANPLDTLKSSPLNRADIFVPVDTTALKERGGSATFVRPLAKGFRIIATRRPGADTPSCGSVGTAAIPNNDSRCALPLVGRSAPSAIRVSSNAAFRVFETSLLDEPVFTTYRVHVADRQTTNIGTSATLRPGLPSTLPVLVPLEEATDSRPPRATLTVTPL